MYVNSDNQAEEITRKIRRAIIIHDNLKILKNIEIRCDLILCISRKIRFYMINTKSMLDNIRGASTSDEGLSALTRGIARDFLHIRKLCLSYLE